MSNGLGVSRFYEFCFAILFKIAFLSTKEAFWTKEFCYLFLPRYSMKRSSMVFNISDLSPRHSVIDLIGCVSCF